MPELILGPLLRYAEVADVTIWVETDAPRSETLCPGRSHVSRLLAQSLLVGPGSVLLARPALSNQGR